MEIVHLRKYRRWGADMVALRATRNSEGCMATTMTNTITITAKALRIICSIVTLLRFGVRL